jgi:hypothetical protein
LRSASLPLQSQALEPTWQQLLFDELEPLELPGLHDATLVHPDGSGLVESPHFAYEP